jgi:pimeloyl-ACP methyl ester carboxylesterase
MSPVRLEHRPPGGVTTSNSAVRFGRLWKRLVLSDGRGMRYLDLGASDGTPVIALHGTPGSGARFAPADAHARSAGLRLIAPDRWGYGGSDPAPAPCLETYANDLRDLADHIGLDRFALMGVSGGGPYAAIAAGILRERITCLALVSPVGPMRGRRGEANGAFHRLCFLALPRIPGALRLIYEPFRALIRISPDAAVRLAAARSPPADRAILTQAHHRSDLAAAFELGLERGTHGAVLDMKLFSREWKPASGPMPPAKLWIGERDGNVPMGAARHLAADTRADMQIVPEAGHMWLATAWPLVLDWLAAHR